MSELRGPRTRTATTFWRAAASLGLGLAAALTVSTWTAVQQHTEDLKSFNTAAASVIAAGQTIQQEINTNRADNDNNHSTSYQLLVNICEHLPGCVVPTSTNTKGAP